MKTETLWKVLIRILIAGTLLAAIKVLFFDYTMDEEYQIMMSYRQLSGDALFREMWEPHQTSAFLTTALMWIYRSLTGTYTGVLLYLRVCTTVIQLAISFLLYRTLLKRTKKEYALLLTLIYFNVVPKIIQIPEFANMQLWFFTLLVLVLMAYYERFETGAKRGWWYMIAAGVAMALEVLSYPSCLLLFPFFLVYIGWKSKGYRVRDILLFAGTCAASAGVWLALILSKVSFAEFVRNVKLLLEFDLTHELSGATNGKVAGIFSNLLWGVVVLAICVFVGIVVALIVKKRRGETTKEQLFTVAGAAAVLTSGVMQLVLWIVCKSGYETYQLHLFLVMAVWLFVRKRKDAQAKLLIPGIVGTLISFAVVVYISDLEMYYALPHGVLGVVFAALVIVYAIEDAWKEKARSVTMIFLIGLCFVCVFGKGYTLRAGRNYNVVLDTESIMKHGPAIGVLSDYMNAYMYNCNYEDFAAYVKPDDTVLIVTNMVHTESTTPYMFGGNQVAHYSIVDPTAYDERLLAYWELYPAKEPDVIVVDCWYGELKEDPSNWIMQYIENDFGYKSVTDGRYVRFYRR